jgi:hypothetical protein
MHRMFDLKTGHPRSRSGFSARGLKTQHLPVFMAGRGLFSDMA